MSSIHAKWLYVLFAVVASLLAASTIAAADPPDAPDDRSIVLADPAVDPPPVLATNVADANATFDRRATRILENVACAAENLGRNTACSTSADCPFSICQICPDGGVCREIANGEMGGLCQNVTGALNSDFAQNLEGWGRDALAKIAYTGPCGTESAAERWAAVGRALQGIRLPLDLTEGSTVDPETLGGQFVERRGELDTGLKELIALFYLYPNRLPAGTVQSLVKVFAPWAGPLPFSGNPPEYTFNFGQIGANYTPESENHTLLELSNQYLLNQLLDDENPATPIVDTQVHDLLAFMMNGILKTDFFEYNAKPYNHYALYAIENLYDFARDSDIKTYAQMILDYYSAKFAISNSIMRRSAPFRRRASHDGNFFFGTRPDEQQCRFLLYTGDLRAIAVATDTINGVRTTSFPATTTVSNGQIYRANNTIAPTNVIYATGCQSAVREAVGSYRVPDAILDMAFNSGIEYQQLFSGGNNYFADLYKNTPGYLVVPGTTELYINEPTYLLAAGGLPQPHDLPDVITGDWADFFLNVIGDDAINYSASVDDFGVSIPIVLFPNDSQESVLTNDPDDPYHPNPGIRPVVDRTQLVRIEGVGFHDSNMCVAPGFACGKNPLLPGQVLIPDAQDPTARTKPTLPDSHYQSIPGDGWLWQFADLVSAPVDTYVAMFTLTPPYLVPPGITGESAVEATYTVGLIEVERADQFQPSGLLSAFDVFKLQVQQTNPGDGIFTEETTYVPDVGLAAFMYPDPPCVAAFQNGERNPAVPCTATIDWAGHYILTTGVDYRFKIPVEEKDSYFTNPSPFGDYAVDSNNSPLYPIQIGDWNSAEGPIAATHTGLIDIRNPRTNQDCQLDLQDPAALTVKGCGVTCSPACSDGFPCQTGDDCLSHQCTNGICAAPTQCAPTCSSGLACGSNLDCASGSCVSGKCAAASCSPNCAAGARCAASADCSTARCMNGTCEPANYDGATCSNSGQCASFNCVKGVCAPASCTTQPGFSVPQCQRGAPCGADTDCASGVCTKGQCGPAPCSGLCSNGAQCGDNSDCASRVCDPVTDRCFPASCSKCNSSVPEGVLCGNCQKGAPCGSNTDCASLVCNGGLCDNPACSPNCPGGHICGNNGDCSSHLCETPKGLTGAFCL